MYFESSQDLRSTAIYGAKNYHFQDIATIHSQDLRTGTTSSESECHLPLHIAF